MKKMLRVVAPLLLVLSGCSTMTRVAPKGDGTYGNDVSFLKQHVEVIELSDSSGDARVAIVPAYQGRVMTSTSAGDAGMSYGWINRDLIITGSFAPHINAFGGEDRFWMGPEGGQSHPGESTARHRGAIRSEDCGLRVQQPTHQ